MYKIFMSNNLTKRETTLHPGVDGRECAHIGQERAVTLFGNRLLYLEVTEDLRDSQQRLRTSEKYIVFSYSCS
jgi:hypothetical protein